MGTEYADQYKSLVAEHVLSVQLSQAEYNQRHNLFQTKGIVKERVIRIIINGGSCNNLVRIDIVEKLSLTTRHHPHPYEGIWCQRGNNKEDNLLLSPIHVLDICLYKPC